VIGYRRSRWGGRCDVVRGEIDDARDALITGDRWHGGGEYRSVIAMYEGCRCSRRWEGVVLVLKECSSYICTDGHDGVDLNNQSSRAVVLVRGFGLNPEA
jgi:hypothetical protein